MKKKVIFDFVRYCINDDRPLPESAQTIDWTIMMLWAQTQGITGVVYRGIEKSGNALNIPLKQLMKWMACARTLQKQNILLDKQCVEIVSKFQNDGFETCILKGQGNAAFFPNPLLRTTGDIDMLVTNRSQREVIKYVKAHNPEGEAAYHHIDWGVYNGFDVEVHYRAAFFFNPVSNRRLQKWLKTHLDVCQQVLPEDIGSIPVPNWEYNVIFQLAHIYKHILHQGIGLKQIIDYYYLLKSNERGHSEIDHQLLRYLGMEKVAEAMMWVMHKVLGLPEQYLIAPLDEKRGKRIMRDIMKGGCFGVSDKETHHADNQFKQNVLRFKRDWRMLRYFPSECLWEPVFRGSHFLWRLANNH